MTDNFEPVIHFCTLKRGKPNAIANPGSGKISPGGVCMASDPSYLSAFISAAAGLGGVWLGGWLTMKREAERERDRIQRERSYLAVLVIAHLDRLATDCLHVARDDGTFEARPAGSDGTHAVTVPAPKFQPLDLQVDWKVLPVDLMYRILNLPYKVDQLLERVAGVREHDEPPDYTDTFWTRQHGFAELGLEVSALARHLRQHAGLPSEHPEQREWSRDDQLRAQRDKIAKMREDYEARMSSRHSLELT